MQLSRIFAVKISTVLFKCWCCYNCFSLVRIMPGDPAVLVLERNEEQNKAAVTEMRHTLGLDQPVLNSIRLGFQIWQNWILENLF